jgi:hypothetical protein
LLCACLSREALPRSDPSLEVLRDSLLRSAEGLCSRRLRGTEGMRSGRRLLRSEELLPQTLPRSDLPSEVRRGSLLRSAAGLCSGRRLLRSAEGLCSGRCLLRSAEGLCSGCRLLRSAEGLCSGRLLRGETLPQALPRSDLPSEVRLRFGLRSGKLLCSRGRLDRNSGRTADSDCCPEGSSGPTGGARSGSGAQGPSSEGPEDDLSVPDSTDLPCAASP